MSVLLQVAPLLLVTLGQAAPAGHIQDTREVEQVDHPAVLLTIYHNLFLQAKQEFIQYFRSVLNGYLSEISPKPVDDTEEVREAKEEFLRVFNSALDGVITAVFEADTQEVREKKEAFLRTFDSAVEDLFVTVEGFYTPEQVEARRRFQEAYKDASEVKCQAF